MASMAHGGGQFSFSAKTYMQGSLLADDIAHRLDHPELSTWVLDYPNCDDRAFRASKARAAAFGASEREVAMLRLRNMNGKRKLAKGHAAKGQAGQWPLLARRDGLEADGSFVDLAHPFFPPAAVVVDGVVARDRGQPRLEAAVFGPVTNIPNAAGDLLDKLNAQLGYGPKAAAE